ARSIELCGDTQHCKIDRRDGRMRGGSPEGLLDKDGEDGRRAAVLEIVGAEIDRHSEDHDQGKRRDSVPACAALAKRFLAPHNELSTEKRKISDALHGYYS